MSSLGGAEGSFSLTHPRTRVIQVLINVSRFKTISEMGGSKQVEVFGKPVFTEATDPREKSPIR